jgi:hypothetical protein
LNPLRCAEGLHGKLIIELATVVVTNQFAIYFKDAFLGPDFEKEPSLLLGQAKNWGLIPLQGIVEEDFTQIKNLTAFNSYAITMIFLVYQTTL